MINLVSRLQRGGARAGRSNGPGPRRWPLRLGLSALGSYLLYLFVFSDQGILHILALRRELARNERYGSMIASKVKIVDEELQRVRTDPFYTEKFIREKTGMVKPGEVVYRVVPESVAAEAVQAKAQLPTVEPGSKTPKKLVWDPNRLK